MKGRGNQVYNPTYCAHCKRLLVIREWLCGKESAASYHRRKFCDRKCSGAAATESRAESKRA